MFKKNKESNMVMEQDMNQLMKAMDAIIGGDYSDTETTEFHNPMYAEKLNQMMHVLKKNNNNYVMRLNDAMGSIGDNSYVKNTLEQVQSQTEYIGEMEKASNNLEQSIANISESMSHIRDNTHEMLAVTQNSTANMNVSIKVVNESSEKISAINVQVQQFQDKIDKISEIVDIVKKVASQSNLLALNASIEAARAGEAGKGFAVVADQVRELSSNTSESAEDIVKYVNELKNDIGKLAESMNDTTSKLEEGNTKVEESLGDIESMNQKMMDINGQIDNIFSDIDTQSNVTKEFTSQIARISDSYGELSKDCMASGTHIFMIGRYIDTTRTDMVRGFSDVTEQDWLTVFDIDHFILMWRVYNNLVDFEHLKITQLNNPQGCKLGKWIARQTNPQITGSAEFKDLVAAHNDIHRYATESWKAKDEGNINKALDNFQKTYDAYNVYKDAIKNLQNRFMQLGITDKTEIVVFKG